jgi:hypothetical protein
MVASINGMNISPITIASRKGSKVTYKDANKSAYYTISLNKAFSKNVVDYAHTLYSTILNLKDSSKQLSSFVDEYKMVEDKLETLDTDKKQQVNDIFKKKAEEFVNSYDAAYHFASNQKHSKALLDFSSELSNITDGYAQILRTIGIIELDQGKPNLEFNVADISNNTDTIGKLEGIKALVEDIYHSTQNILSKPMAEHMNFKGLKYYYNYELGRYYSNTFELIESGMIVDVAL